jgi:hypothetical protein
MQVIRAIVALGVIGGVATAETLSTPAVDIDCPLAKIARPQRILLLDPSHGHPVWIDASNGASGGGQLQHAVDTVRVSHPYVVIAS